MSDCRRAKEEEYEDIIDFINYVFSQNECPHDFKKILPKLYGEGKNYAEYHYLITEAGKIKALVCAMPISYQVGKSSIKACCIGMVSVHPYARSKGYMKELMKYVIEEVKAQGCQYIFLGGQRQRYEYFGFEPSGTKVEFTVTKTNIRHCYKELDISSVRLVPLTEEALLHRAYSLYEAQGSKALREKEDFYDILCSWQGKPYAVLLGAEFAGYLCLSQEGAVTELLLEHAEHYPNVLKGLFSFTGAESHSFQAGPLEIDKMNFLMQMAESFQIITCENYLILDWKSVLQAYLEAKAATETLSEGSVILGIGEAVWELTIKENTPFVRTAEKEPDLTFTALEATALLFSCPGEFKLAQYGNKLNGDKRNCIKSWFPLPLTALSNDCC